MELAGPNGKSFIMDPSELAELTIVKVPKTAEDFHAMWLQSGESKIVEQARQRAVGVQVRLSRSPAVAFSTPTKTPRGRGLGRWQLATR